MKSHGFGGDVVPNSNTSGSLTATGSVALAVAGRQSVGIRISNTFVGTLLFEGSIDDGSNYDPLAVWDVTNGKIVTSTTGTGDFLAIDVSGLTHVRVRCSVFTSGTIDITLRAVAASSRRSQTQAAPGQAAPPETNALGATDGSLMRALVALAAIPAGSEYALVSRPILDNRALSGSLTAATQAATVSMDGRQSVGLELSGTWSATLVGQVTFDGSTWTTVPLLDLATGTLVASAVANGSYAIPYVAGARSARVYCSAYTSGTVVVTGAATTASGETRPAKRQTYAYEFSCVAAGAGVFFNVAGSATRTTKVRQVFLRKPSVAVVISAKKTSTAASGGTSAAITATPRRSSNRAASASVKKFTAVPTAGTAIGDGLGSIDLATTEQGTLNYGGGDDGDETQEVTLDGAAETLELHTDVAATIKGFVVVEEE